MIKALNPGGDLKRKIPFSLKRFLRWRESCSKEKNVTALKETKRFPLRGTVSIQRERVEV